MPIQITGSWNLTGSFTASAGFQGTASYATYALSASYAPGGGGGAAFPYTGAAEISGSLAINKIPVQFYNPGSSVFVTPDYTIVLVTGSTNEVHISQSGIYNIDLTLIPSASSFNTNIYYWLDLLPSYPSETQIALNIPSGSGQIIAFRTLITASNSTEWWASSQPGISTATVNRGNSAQRRYTSPNSAAPFQIIKSINGIYLGRGPTATSGDEWFYFRFTGSTGTPL